MESKGRLNALRIASCRARHMTIFGTLRLRSRAAQRLGAFSRATKQGMSPDDARAYSDKLYPPTAEDLAYEASLKSGKIPALPVASAISLLYPLAAAIYIARTPASRTQIVGYALAQLSYVLFAAGVLAGTFRVFGLKKRTHVLACGVAVFVIGIVLSNVGA